MNALSLPDRWRPRTLSDIRGQPGVVADLRSFLESPTSVAFLFAGGTGVGKTSAAIAFARELGVDVEQEEFGGLYQVASGEQTAETVRQLVKDLRHFPMFGSGWRVAIVNEADSVTPGAAVVWLDVLENLPERCVVIFTTNNPDTMPARWRDRCETVAFKSTTRALKTFAEAFVDDVWKQEGASGEPPTLEQLNAVSDGEISFRRILQAMAPFLRAAKGRVSA